MCASKTKKVAKRKIITDNVQELVAPVAKEQRSFADKKAAYLKALVKKFGEGAVVTRKDLFDVHAGKSDIYAHPAVVRKDTDYRIVDETGEYLVRGRYVVTESDNPAKVRDRVSKKWNKEQAKAELEMLPKEVRQSPAKLAKAIKGANDSSSHSPKGKKASAA